MFILYMTAQDDDGKSLVYRGRQRLCYAGLFHQLNPSDCVWFVPGTFDSNGDGLYWDSINSPLTSEGLPRIHG